MNRVGFEGLVIGKRQRVLAIDLTKDPFEVPGFDILGGFIGKFGAALELPAVGLEVGPVPIAEDRMQSGFHRVRCGLYFAQAQDGFGRITPLDVALETDFSGQGQSGFRVGFLVESLLADGFEFFDCGFGQALLDRFFDLFPHRYSFLREYGLAVAARGLLGGLDGKDCVLGKQEAHCGEQKSCEHREVHEISKRVAQWVRRGFGAAQVQRESAKFIRSLIQDLASLGILGPQGGLVNGG